MTVGGELGGSGGLLEHRLPQAGGDTPADQFAPLLHRARLRRPLRPAEPLRALVERLAQRLGGERGVVHVVDVGVVEQAERERVDARLAGQLVDRDLEHRHAGGGTRRAHVGRGIGVARRDRVAALDVGAGIVDHAPDDDVLHVVLEPRGRGGGVAEHRRQLAVRVRAEPDLVGAFRPVGVAEHLRAGHHHTDRAFEVDRRHRCDLELPLRAQRAAEAATDIGVHHPHIVGAEPERVRHQLLRGLRALDLVVDRDLAVAVPMYGRGVHLHLHLVLDREMVVGRVLERRIGECGLGIAPVLGRMIGVALLARAGQELLGERRREVDIVRLGLVRDLDQAGREPRRLERLGDHHRDRLRVELDAIVVERLERIAGNLELVLPALGPPGVMRPVAMAQYVHHARHRARGLLVDRDDPPLGDRRHDGDAVEQVGNSILGGVLRLAGDLGDAVHTADRAADADFLGCVHGDVPHAMRLSVWDCGVPAAA